MSEHTSEHIVPVRTRHSDLTSLSKGTGTSVDVSSTTIASDADTLAQIHGIAVRTAKTPDTYGSNVAAYHPGEYVDVLTSGCAVVHVASGSPRPGAKVYWTSAGFTATYTQHAVAEITNMHFKTGKDPNGNAEVLISPRII